VNTDHFSGSGEEGERVDCTGENEKGNTRQIT
jgi:hypothetical protein